MRELASRRAQWLLAVITCRFDLDAGSIVDQSHPGNTLTDAELRDVAYVALPVRAFQAGDSAGFWVAWQQSHWHVCDAVLCGAVLRSACCKLQCYGSEGMSGKVQESTSGLSDTQSSIADRCALCCVLDGTLRT